MGRNAKRMLGWLLAVALLCSLTACGNPGTGKETAGSSTTDAHTTAEADSCVFTDDSGREVELPAQIERIVPSGSLAQIILFAIAPDMFVGLANSFYEEAKGIIAEEYRNLPYFGSLYSGADLNVEQLALAQPDVLIDIGDSKEGVAENLDKLQKQTGIPSVFVYSTLEDMPETYRTLGKLLGREERGEELAQFCEKVYNRTITIMDKVGDKKVNALYILGEDGLNVIARGSYHAELMDLLTDNLAVVDNPISKGTGNAVTMEQIAVWNPDFIVFGPGSIYDKVADMDTWDQMNAIQNGKYVETPDTPHNWMSMPPSAQRFLSLIWLTAELYPEYCDYDVKAEIVEYFKLFYECDLTDDQYNAITANIHVK